MKKVIAVSGDIMYDDLGIEKEMLNEIQNEVSTVQTDYVTVSPLAFYYDLAFSSVLFCLQ